MSFLELRDIHVEKHKQPYLMNINLEINKGEYIALLGPTNSGKTSMLNVIAGLLPVTRGSIYYDNTEITHVAPEDRNTGYVFENYNLFPHLTVMENLLFGAKMKQLDLATAHAEAREVLRIMHLEGREDAFPHELSGGMQQRVAIARAVVAGAKILLLDEPYRALDAKIREEMRFEIRRIVKSLNLTCIHATHEVEEAMIVADRIVIMNKGRIEQVATPQDLFLHPKNYYVATTIAENNVINYSAISRSELETKEVLPNLTLSQIMQVQANEQGEQNIQNLIQNNDNLSFKILIKYSDITFQPVQDFEQKERVIDPLTRIKKENGTEYYIARGKITRIRLLGEYIRFVIDLQDPKGEGRQSITSKLLLSLDLRNYQELLGKNVVIKIPMNRIMVFSEP